MPSEWDITKYLNDKGWQCNCDGGFRWSLVLTSNARTIGVSAGIEQDVYLYPTPMQYIADYNTTASVDKQTDGSC